MKNKRIWAGLLGLLLVTGLLWIGCEDNAGGKTYTVEFSKNGGTGAEPADIKAKAGSEITLPGRGKLSRTGYKFDGWRTSKSSGTTYKAGASFTVDDDYVLYAKWLEDGGDVTVTYDANGGDGAPPAPKTDTIGAEITLAGKGTLIAPAGTDFMGWNTSPNGAGEFHQAGASYTLIGDITLYAFWLDSSAARVTVTYDANGATDGAVPGAQTIVKNTDITVSSPGNLSYASRIFESWNDKRDGTGYEYNPGETLTVEENTTLYAQWRIAGDVTLYRVTYNGNGGTGQLPQSQEVPAETPITVATQGGLSKTGATFTGWNTAQNGGGTSYAAGASLRVISNITLYAQWSGGQSVTTYTVTYDANGGTGAPAGETVRANAVHIVKAAGSMAPPSGKVFDNKWNTKSDGSGTNYTPSGSLQVTANVTLYAQWRNGGTPNPGGDTYTVTFDANNATGGTAPAAMTQASAGAGITLPGQGDLEKTDCTFGGWSANPAGAGTSYAAGYSYRPTTNTTLYAKWNARQVIPPGTEQAVWFQANQGYGGSQRVTTTTGSLTLLGEADGYNRPGYTFGGWATNASGTGDIYEAGSVFSPTELTTYLYAKWIAPVYTVEYQAGEGSGTPPAARTVQSNNPVITLEGADTFTAPAGKVFAQWNTKADGTGEPWMAGATYVVAGNVVFHAIFGLPSTGTDFDQTAIQLVAKIKVGWNLGNTLDAPGGETGWGNPQTTLGMITTVKNAGFNAIRIPVTWTRSNGYNPANAEPVATAFINRVQEVVDYAVSQGMYIILNTHHDEQGAGTLIFGNNDASSIAEFAKLWTQIANKFKSYNEKLIFESLNEPRIKNGPDEWNGGNPTQHASINRHHAAMLNAVRATGGNNEKRFILFNTHAASATTVAMNALVIPPDPLNAAQNKRIAGFHAYVPNNFCFGSPVTTWDGTLPTSAMDAFNNYWTKSQGIPVIIGEFGSNNKNNTAARASHARAYVNAANERDIPCFVWDMGKNLISMSEGQDSGYGLLNRDNNTWWYPEIVQALTGVARPK